uniref:Uncharacterized protein n=1 Tax=Vespula pensylvanica TaxID=30213 RepID=A0A834P6U3_VESPE|nr:hypothetical protein H0235_004188 [Vespula pensylvanica]
MIPQGGSRPLTRGNDDDARTTADTQVTDNAEANGTDTERQLIILKESRRTSEEGGGHETPNETLAVSIKFELIRKEEPRSISPKRLTTSVRCEQGFRCIHVAAVCGFSEKLTVEV